MRTDRLRIRALLKGPDMGGTPAAEKQCLASRPVEVNERHYVLQLVHKQGHALLRFVPL